MVSRTRNLEQQEGDEQGASCQRRRRVDSTLYTHSLTRHQESTSTSQPASRLTNSPLTQPAAEVLRDAGRDWDWFCQTFQSCHNRRLNRSHRASRRHEIAQLAATARRKRQANESLQGVLRWLGRVTRGRQDVSLFLQDLLGLLSHKVPPTP